MKKNIMILGIMILLMVASVSAYNGDFCTETNSPCGGGCTSTDLSLMYNGYDFVTDSLGVGDITGWNTSCITNMVRLFRNSNFNQDIGAWDVSSVTSMSGMFQLASTFNQDIGTWNVSSVTDMSRMFADASSFNQQLDSWDVSNVELFLVMFDGASSFNQPLNSWDVTGTNNNVNPSSVYAFSGMFRDAISFNQPLSNWDVTFSYGDHDFNLMFSGATSFDQDLSSWNITDVADDRDGLGYFLSFEGFMTGVNLSSDNYDVLLAGWSSQNINSNLYLDAGDSKYTDSVSRAILTDTYNWTIIDGGLLVTNTAPVINSISPSERIELQLGDSQLYTANVTDTEDDATYAWTIDDVLVATSETYLADYDNIEAGIHTLKLEVSDLEYSDDISVILEIRGVGGSSSGVSVQTSSSSNSITGNVVSISNETTTNVAVHRNLWQRFIAWAKQTMNRIRGN